MESVEAKIGQPKEISGLFLVYKHRLNREGDIVLGLPSGEVILPNFTGRCPDPSKPIKIIIEVLCLP